MGAFSRIYLNYWERYYQPDVNINCTLENRFSSSLLILLDCGSLLVLPNTFLVLVVRHTHWLKESHREAYGKHMVTFQTPVISWLDAYSFQYQYLPRKLKITHGVIDFFQRQGLVHSMHSIAAVQNYQCVSNWLFCAFSWPKNKVKIRFRTQLRQS